MQKLQQKNTINETLSKNEQIDKIFEYINGLIPSNILITCPEWAEKYRCMSKKITRRTGSFSFENAPYCREIADCFSKNSPVREVASMKGVQLGFTTSVVENAIGYIIDVDPSPAMFAFPTDKDCEEYKKLKIDNLIDNSGLRHKIVAETENRNTRRTGDTASMIEFQNGFLKLVSARKGNALRSTHIKYLFLDELDAYPDEIKGEGSPIAIAKKRTDSYSKEKKIFYNSTPVMAHKSKIYELYIKGDQRKFLVPCPYCGQMQELVFYQPDGGLYDTNKAVIKNNCKVKPYGIVFNADECRDGNYDSVAYRCKYCGEEFRDYQKRAILQNGKWVPSEKSKIPYFRSYHISALYSLTKPWWEIVFDFLDAGRDPKKLQSFYNLDLGLPFEDKTGGVEYQTVHRLKDDKMLNNVVPKEALFLTCVADVQRNRIECEIKAWGDRYRGWGIDHRIFEGNTADIFDPCWQNLLKIKDEVFTDGRQVELILPDSGDGELTDTVYRFCYTFGDGLILPLKGLVSTTRTKEKYRFAEIKDYDGLVLVEIYVDLYKNMLASYLGQPERVDGTHPDGWQTFSQGYSNEYFRQLTTEKKVRVKTPGGLEAVKWVQHGRNEAWDLCVYSLAACDVVLHQYSTVYLGLDCTNPKAAFECIKSMRNKKKDEQ